MSEQLRRALLAAIKSRCTINENGCWLWNGSLCDDGYGQTNPITVDGKTVRRTHRVAFYLAYGWLPQLLDHKVCDTPKCCNPAHLEPSTDKKNVLRGKGPTAINAQKERCPKGHPYSPKFQQGGWTRICKTCRSKQQQAYRLRKLARRSGDEA